MIITLPKISKGLIFGTIIAISGNFSASAAPPNPNQCPEGWISRPAQVNFQLGPCLPGTILAPTQSEPIEQADLKLDLLKKENRNTTRIESKSRIRVQTNSN